MHPKRTTGVQPSEDKRTRKNTKPAEDWEADGTKEREKEQNKEKKKYK
jgi:hypothetical protein